MKLVNNKGFSIIEIIICFAFTMVIAIGLFLIASNYKTKQQLESSKRDLQTYKTTLVFDIQKDITEKGLSKIETCDSIDNCYEITFNDETQKIIQKTSKTIIYGNIDYPLKEQALTTIGSFSLKSQEHTATTQGWTGTATVYKLLIPINHSEITEDYNIEIIATAFKH